ncbi:enoyl-CoA hydratase/isomerase family protein [Alicyclobacillus mengziensis]|uniref:Enoyl-CoA hydratase/isomerase family protein n=1 Tax=Alicyclobacillus mengziensis TaxID=2931921 RepID=A0A9X7VYB9_9BACL|nr:enoyl-CoA hydratase-related protein [Alicyclobacillus mengziensis]QSO47289.1 enoyl-CoA hydratase/isomerase family protein [Alicyclobacillus mengziensis]
MAEKQRQELVYVDIHDAIGEVVLNRPEKRNALNLEMWNMLGEAIRTCGANPDVSVVLLRGANRTVFCAGADISEFQTVRRDSVANQAYSAAVKGVVMGLKKLPKPTIAMISGFCVGGGTEIAVACDFRFASTTVMMGITPAKLGFVYDVEETKMLVDLVGPSHTKDILLSARLMEAEEAFRIGLVDRLYREEDLEKETFKYIGLLLQNAPNSVRGAKAIIDGLVSGVSPEDPGLKQIVRDALDSPQYKEGVQAFIEKRRPEFPRL